MFVTDYTKHLLDNVKKIHFIGCGGSGMYPLIQILNAKGYVISGSDVLDGTVRLVATTWEWAEEIDQARAEASKKRAEELLAQKNLDKRDYELAQARLKRALVRTSIHP